ncbi:hypothetical protein TUMEXPCC7403_01225 [Tumidithrix helvetica PCC 7403]|uniref:hypothetical protein n=1 Tax=Tumidithrix helvetica TaxID=3457545 RepID=UPI003CBAC1F6
MLARSKINKAIAWLLLLSLGTPTPVFALPPEIGEFTLDQLFASGGGGCGMTLWKPNLTPRNSDRRNYIFFNGLNQDNNSKRPMLMMLDGQIAKFRRIKARGSDFYGQKTFQTFQSLDGKIIVEVEVTLGKLGEIESVAIDKGVIRVKKIGEPAIVIPVVGDAGC